MITTQNKKNLRFVFFGTSLFSTLVLDKLMHHGLIPSLIVTTPDKPQGRKRELTPTPVKVWALNNDISHLEPDTLGETTQKQLHDQDADVFLVASYGKIMPKRILDIPRHGSLNIHPSLLPKLRGASPIESAILHEDHTGVTIMQMDDKMDHGPIVAQREVSLTEWPPKKALLEAVLAKEGAALFANVLPQWVAGDIEATPQDHEQATFCQKLTKDQAAIDFNDDPRTNYRKIQAFHEWPRPYFFITNGDAQMRVIITGADLTDDGELQLTSVIPEGKKEMSYEEFERGFLNQ